jgi:hypothetical protein
MTEEAARKTANVILGAAAVAAAIYVVRTPRRRRLAWRLAVTALTGSIPAWFGEEITHAWAAAGRQRDLEGEVRSAAVPARQTRAL